MFGVSCTVDIGHSLPPLPRDIALHLFRIVQEATHNAGRHGQPDHIWIRCRLNEDLRPTIAEDGKDLPEDVSERRPGLHPIRYRTEVIGASCDIRSRRGGGTEIRCCLPRRHIEGNRDD